MLSLDCEGDAGGCWNGDATAWRMSLRLAMRVEAEGATPAMTFTMITRRARVREAMKMRCDARSIMR